MMIENRAIFHTSKSQTYTYATKIINIYVLIYMQLKANLKIKTTVP